MKKFHSNFTKSSIINRKGLFILTLLLASFNLFSQSYSPIVVTGFNEEIVANGATMVGPPGNALSFDGATENIVLTGLSSDITWSNDMSWEVWFKSTGLPTSGNSCILGMENAGVPRV